MFVTVIVLRYALLVSQWSHGHFLELIQFYLNNSINLRHLTQRIISCYTHKMAIVSWPDTLWRHFTLWILLQLSSQKISIQYFVKRKLWSLRKPHAFTASHFNTMLHDDVPSVLWRCWLGCRKGIRPVKTERWGAGVVICLERDADLHMAQPMPLPLTVSCFSKIQIGFTFLVPAHPGSPRQRAVKWVCVLHNDGQGQKPITLLHSALHQSTQHSSRAELQMCNENVYYTFCYQNVLQTCVSFSSTYQHLYDRILISHSTHHRQSRRDVLKSKLN